MKQQAIDKLVSEALAIEAEEAQKAGALGFMLRAMAQATIPHKKVEGSEFTRTNGSFSLSILSPAAIGIPYGSLPRLLMTWVTTEAVRTKERELHLGNTLSEFMGELDMAPTGGRWGSIPRLRTQMERLFNSTISCNFVSDEIHAGTGFRVTDKYMLWWDQKRPDQRGLWDSKVVLTQEFFDEATTAPVPVDMRALKALRRSPMALDLYVWLTYRMSYLKRPTIILWEGLRAQFGADYARTRAFKEAFLKHLKAVSVVYPEAKVADAGYGLELKPSKTHARKKLSHMKVGKK